MKILNYEWAGKKVLITGASGFKGSWLSEALLLLGSTVYGTVRNRRDPNSAYDILDLENKIVKVSADISDRQQVRDLINSISPDVIFHLAAKALVPVSLRDPRRTFEVNIMGTINIIEACRELRVVEKLIICSTDHVFGHVKEEEFPPKGFDERSRVSYGGPYDSSKSAMELVVRSYHYTYWEELPAISITRCANVFGYGDVNQRRVVPLFINSAINENKINLKFRKNGRQFIHISDAVRGYIRVASLEDEGGTKNKTGKPKPEKRSPFTPTYHFAIEKYQNTDEPFIRMRALADLVSSIFNNVMVLEDPDCTDFAQGENEMQALNCKETRKKLRWRPIKSMDIGIKELGEWYKKENQTRRKLNELIDSKITELIEDLKK